jgi:hypothetical protein
MSRIIRKSERVPGGYRVTIEVTNAYTDGSSRFDRVFVEREAVEGKTLAERRQALFAAAAADPVADLRGEEVAEPTPTKEILEERAVARYEQWQRWKTTRVEAEGRGLAAPVVSALQAREDVAWAAYLAVLNAWRQA